MRPASALKSVIMHFAVAIPLFAMAGCVVHSVNPFYGKETITDLPGLYGKWLLKESKVDEGLNREWAFSADKIMVPDKKGGFSALSSRFFKIDDMLFLDAIADAPPDGLGFWWVLHVAPMHTVSRVIAEEKTLKIIPLNATWMEAAVKNRTVLLPSIWHQDLNAYLFTASSAEWVEFLRKYGKNQNVFLEKDAFVFRRP